MKIQYNYPDLKPRTLQVIDEANEIIDEYLDQGFSLTLRQLYYQFVSRGYLDNTQRNYKRLGDVVSKGRMAGLIDWESIEDRTRALHGHYHDHSPAEAIQDARDGYFIDMWEGQPVRMEVWIEKEALTGVISGVCSDLDVPYFACKGYVSQSEQWRAHRRISRRDVPTIILHLGDHDPSGIDMTRDNSDRLKTFSDVDGGHFTEVRRIALSMGQIERHKPPPNPAKMTDSRYGAYRRKYGVNSWELDALPPSFIADLIKDNIRAEIDDDAWQAREEALEEDRKTLDRMIKLASQGA